MVVSHENCNLLKCDFVCANLFWVQVVIDSFT